MKKLLLLFLLPLAAFSQTQQQCDQGRCSGLGAPVGICTPGSKYTQAQGAGNQPTLWQCGGIPPTWVAGGVTDNTKVPLAGGAMTGALTTPGIASAIQPEFNAMAYGATGISLPGVANYAAGSPNITVTSGSGFQVGQLLILKGAGINGSPVTLNSCSTTAGITLFTTGTQSFRPGEPLFIQGFTGACAGFNGQTLTVSLANLSTTQFQASTTLSLTGTDSGTASQPADLEGKIATIAGNVITGVAVTGGSASMIPALTVTGAAIGWGNDDTSFIQSAINAACSLPRGFVGANLPRVLIPQGGWNITTPLTFGSCGHITGVGGSAGTRLIFWFNNGSHAGTCGTGAMLQITNSPSSMPENMQFFTASKNFVPDCTIEASGFLDQEAHWHDLTFQSASQVANIWLDDYPLNGRLDHIATRDLCGDFIHITAKPDVARADFPISYFTVDFGSGVSNAQSCMAQAVVDVDVSGVTGASNTLVLEHARIEDQSGTLFNTADVTQPPLIKFSTGGVSSSFHVGEIRVDGVTFNILGAGTQQVAIAGTTDTQGKSCPAPDYTNLTTNGAIVAGWSSPTGTWCNGLPIQQIPEIADSASLQTPNIIPRWAPNAGGDSNSAVWTGNIPDNKVSDSGFFLVASQTPWTTPASWAICTGCGYLDSNGIQLANNGSSYTGTLPQNNVTIPVTPGQVWFLGGWVDCSSLTSGTAGFLARGNGGLTFTPKCPTPGTPLSEADGIVTIPAGNTSVTIQADPFGATGPNGTFVTFSHPQFNLLFSPASPSAAIPNTPVPYVAGASFLPSLRGSVTNTAALAAPVTIAGVSTSNACVTSPTNAIASGNVHPFITLSANTVTLNWAAAPTTGGTYSILCQ